MRLQLAAVPRLQRGLPRRRSTPAFRSTPTFVSPSQRGLWISSPPPVRDLSHREGGKIDLPQRRHGVKRFPFTADFPPLWRKCPMSARG